MCSRLTGTIPERAVHADHLTTFLLNENMLTGTIPDSMTDWANTLKYCSLGGNKWACPVPAGISDKCQAYCT